MKRIPTKKKIVALTFDDGPNEPYTSQLLAILKAEGIRSTFFLVGENAQKYPDVVRRIFADGHVIGNHSTHHQFRYYFFQPSFEKEIQTTQNILTEITGVTPRFFRAPWLFRTPWLLRTVKKNNLQPVWGVFGSELEIVLKKPEAIFRRALAKLRPGTIFIFHDGYNNKGASRETTIEAVRLLIPELKKRGYEFVTMEEV